MLHLAAGDWGATLLPERGAAMTRLTWRGRDVLAPLPDGADPNDTPAGAFVMAPWTNRLDAGRIGVAGRAWHLPVNRQQDGTAIHGLVRDHAWQVESANADDAVLTQSLDHAPFRCDARLEVVLGAEGLSLRLALTARGHVQPLGIGWHPWFARPVGIWLALGARWRCRHDARQLPVAAEPFARLHGDESSYLGLDTHFAGWDGVATIRHPDGAAFRLAASGAWAGNLQVYGPPAQPVLCVEPVSHLPDAPNRPVLAALGPMILCAPGEGLTGQLTLSLAP